MANKCVVIGSGPGGYTAAFRAADLGLEVTLIEKGPRLGGVCLNVGCIPSKALLHVAQILEETKEFNNRGITFTPPTIDASSLVKWKESVVTRLTGGLNMLAKKRKVNVIMGEAEFISPTELQVTHLAGKEKLSFDNAIIAVGSRPVELPFLPKDPRIMDSTGALEINFIPKRLLVLGGGIIGMEMATVYYALGSKITVVEMQDGLLSGADKDIVMPLYKRVEKRYEKILLETKVVKVEAQANGLDVYFEGKNAPATKETFDAILCAVGRIPNGKTICAEKAGVHVDEKGFIPVDKQQRTNVSHIFAIGDVVGNPMLAHKAMPEGRVAAEVIAGQKHSFEPRCIPAVAYTDPEVAWAGITEAEAKQKNLEYGKGTFPWMASGRSLSLGRDEGLTKIIFDAQSNRVIGAGIVGPNAGELISEVALAIEMGAEAEDIALTIHPHPTLSETIAQSAEAYLGTITDLYMPQQPRDKT